MTESSQSLLYTPLYIADGEGFFKEEGLDVTIVAAGGGAKASAAAIGGSAQIVAGATSHTIDAARQGKLQVAFAASENQWADPIVISEKKWQALHLSDQTPLAEKVKALKGLRLGITSPGSATDQIFRALLVDAGLNPDRDVQIVAMGDGATALAALQHGQIDAFSMASPTVETAIQKGYGHMLVNTLAGEYQPLDGMNYTSFQVEKSYLDQHPDVIQRFANAIAKAEAFLRDHPAESEKLLHDKYFKETDPQVFHLAFQDNYPALAKTPVLTRDAVAKNVTFMEHVTGQKVDVNVDSLYTNEFAQKAAAALGQ